MQLIKNIVITKVGKEYLLINTLNGLIDLVSEGVVDTINKWSQYKTISIDNEYESELYNRLKEREYLCESEEEEFLKKKELIAKLRNAQEKRSNQINSISFVLTYDCNFSCPYCFEGANINMQGQYITREQVDKVLNYAGDGLKHIGLFGGEPLLPKNHAIIEYIVSKAPNKEYSIITNGYYLDEYMDILKRISVEFVMVTLDGRQEVHDRRRICKNGEKTYNTIMRNIAMCLDNNIPIRIRMNVDAGNINEIEALRNELLSRVSPIVNCVINGKSLRPRYAYCAEEENVWIVDPVGLIYPCLTAVGKREYAIGRYYPKMEFFENNVKCRNIETIEKCRDCKYALLCGGGCPLKTMVSQGVYAPECATILNDLYRVIPKLWEIKNEIQ